MEQEEIHRNQRGEYEVNCCKFEQIKFTEINYRSKFMEFNYISQLA